MRFKFHIPYSKFFIPRAGFTLVELIIYIGIFAVVSGGLTGILLTSLQVNQRESASSEVTQQLNYSLQTIERLVRSSSNVAIPAGIPTSTLVLRTENPANDPTIISWNGTALTLQQGAAASTTITTSKVVVNSATFQKNSNYPGHDVVTVNLTVTYNSPSTGVQVQRTLTSAIGRVSAATFDSDLVPGAGYTYNIGQSGSPWQYAYLGNGNAGTPSYTFSANTGVGLFSPGTNILGFSTGGIERMRIDSGGNVGIGTASPGAMLDVNGSAQFEGNKIRTSSISYPMGFLTGPADANGAMGRAGFYGDTGFLSDNLTYNGLNWVGDYATSSGAMWLVQGGIGTFYTRAGGASGLTAAMTILNNGNVGIGTNTPGNPLTVVGTAAHSMPMIDVQGNGDIRLAAQGTLFFDNNYNYGAGSYIGPYSNTSLAYDANTQKFSTAGVERMRITSSGNVGIGKTNPATALDVNGTITGTTKNFEISDPIRPGYDLVHSTLEGPEIAVFYRGTAGLKNGSVLIELPPYFNALTRGGSATVLLTAKGGKPFLLSYDQFNGKSFMVYGTVPDGEFDWEVKATRADQPPLEVERPSR